MVEDIRHPEKPETSAPPEDTSQNKQNISEQTHHYDEAGEFVAINSKRSKKSRSGKIKVPAFITNASKKQKIIGGILVAVLLLGAGGGVYAFFNNGSSKPEPAPVVQKAEPEPAKPTTEASKLTGMQISPELNKRPITSVQIENSPDARPQAGLKDAGVVYEAIAEGGITRFNASFQESQPEHIGPVRSVRPYYAVLAAPFDPVFVHAGGSADGLAKLRQLGLKDMDHGANGNTFQRVSNRFAPHNLYTSTAALDKASQGRGYTSSDAKSFVRKEEQKGQAVTARAIDLNISSALYNVHYDYDLASNAYLRTMGGRPHTDERSGQQIAPKVVVALVMSYSQSGIYSVYQTNGSGRAFIFQDGTVLQANWNKAGDKDQFTFTLDDGNPVALNAGQTWLTLVKAPNAVTFAP